MKAVAARLGSYSAMALYRYVHSKDGLVDLMLDAATAEIPLPPQPGPDCRADLEELAAYPSGPSPEEQFGLGLGFLLDGMARCLAGAESPARSDKIGP